LPKSVWKSARAGLASASAGTAITGATEFTKSDDMRADGIEPTTAEDAVSRFADVFRMARL
jgi:hypothetical protein